MMQQPKPTLTLVATLHEPIDATVLAAVLNANSGMPIGPWAATAFEVRVRNAVRGGACLEIYKRVFREPESPEQALERLVREMAQQRRPPEDIVTKAGIQLAQERLQGASMADAFDKQLGDLGESPITPAMAEHRAHAATTDSVPYNLSEIDPRLTNNPNAGYSGARA